MNLKTQSQALVKNEKIRLKKLFGGPSEDAFFTLSHILSTFVDQLDHLLTAKGFEHVLIGRIQKEPIENVASVSRHLGYNII